MCVPFYGPYCTVPFAKINLIITITGNKMVKNGILKNEIHIFAVSNLKIHNSVY